MLEGAGGRREVDRLLEGEPLLDTGDNPGCKGVTAADPVDDVHRVLGGKGRLPLLPEDPFKPVVAGRKAAALGQGDHRDMVTGIDPPGSLGRARGGEVGVLPGEVGCVDFEDGADMLLVGDQQVDIPHQRLHHRLCLLHRPHLAAVVEVAADGEAHPFCCPHRLEGCRRHFGADGRGDAGEVEPARPLEDRLPVKVGRFRLGNRRARPVVDDLGGPLGGAVFDKVNPDAVPLPEDRPGVDPEAAEGVDRRLPHLVGRKGGDKSGLQPELGEPHRDVCLPAAVADVQALCLHKPPMGRR